MTTPSSIERLRRGSRRWARYEFRPERFLGDDVPRDAWIPFGGGRRHCVGSHLALLEMKVVIAEVLRRLRPEAPDAGDERQRMHHVTLVPSKGALAVAHARPRSAAEA